MIDFFRRFPLFALAVIVLVVFLVLLGLVLFPRDSQQTPTNLLTPTPVPVNVSDEPLTESELSFPQATPQSFRNQDAPSSGTLVVTSDIEGVLVTIDTIGIHPEEGDPIGPGEKWPQNTAPFTIRNMPTGTHYLTAIAPGKPYDMGEYEYEIESGEITRVHIVLKPLRTSN